MAGVELPNGTREATPQGVPQGGPLSPLLANIALDPLDKELEARGHKFARYADDFIVMVKSANAAKRVLASLVRYCEGRLRLYYWKQWKQPRTRRRNLLALGADPATVHMATRSRKGYWRMSQNEIVRFALNNRWLEEQGVPDMNAPAAIAARKTREARLHGRSAAESKPSGSFFTTGRKPVSDWNRPVRSRTQGGVGPGS